MYKILFLILIQQALSAQVFIEERRIGGEGDSLKFSQPAAIDAAPDGSFYLVDSGTNDIYVFNNSGFLQKSVGGFGFKNDQFDRPVDIWTRDLLNIFIADYNNQRVLRYNRTMHYVSSLVSEESHAPEFQFTEAASCAVNSQNDLFILDSGENKIIKFNRFSEPERSFGGYESGNARLEEPVQLDLADDKFLLVSDRSSKAVFIFDFFGNYVRSISLPDFKSPSGLAVDRGNRIFIADPAAKKIFVTTSDFSNISTLKLNLTQPLKQPLDLAVRQLPGKKKKMYRMFLIDANQLIIGRLTDSCD